MSVYMMVFLFLRACALQGIRWLIDARRRLTCELENA